MPQSFPTLLPIHTGHYPDRITLQSLGTTPDPNSGEQIEVFADVAELTQLACRVTPASLSEQMESTERRYGNRTELVELRRVAIPQHLPQIVSSMRAEIVEKANPTPETWSIRAVQAEEHVSLTRLLVEQVTL